MADAALVTFELVSPEKLLLSDEVEMVVVPGTEGDFGVLPQHSPLLSTIRPGVIDVYKDDKVAEKIFVAGGFAEVTETTCTVLAEEAANLKDLARADLEKRLKHAEELLQEADTAEARHDAEREVVIAQAMLDALTEYEKTRH